MLGRTFLGVTMKKTSTLILGLALAATVTTAYANAHWADSTETTTTDSVSTGTLTLAEAQDLTYLREEEKLARDTYITLYSQWGLAIFDKISQSEQTHMDAVKALLDKYGLEDPAQPQVGIFTDPHLQEAYDQLVARGSQSIIEALMVGGYIEELDIQDLQKKMLETTKNDILNVYENLQSGSRSHLIAFVTQVEYRGIDYEAQILDQETVDSIVGTIE